jgi:phage shock protein PspC (stress-responsive transcriptional regulator)
MSSRTEDPTFPEDFHSGEQPGTGEPSATSRAALRRPVRGRMVAGVAAGIARHFNVDVTIVRVIFAVLTIAGFTGLPFLGAVPLYLAGIPLYLACWVLIPEEGSDASIAAGLLGSASRDPDR